jgi:hypothetical protein
MADGGPRSAVGGRKRMGRPLRSGPLETVRCDLELDPKTQLRQALFALSGVAGVRVGLAERVE